MRARWWMLVLATSPAAHADPPEVSPRPAWASESRSPRPYGKTRDPLWSLCPEPDQALTTAARRMASERIIAEDLPTILHTAGDPHVSPRGLLLEARHLAGPEIVGRVRAWLDASPPIGGSRRRCGFASVSAPDGMRFAAIALDALADLAAVPLQVRPGTWVDIDARINVPASGGKVVVQTPDGEVHSLLSSFSSGRVRARANVDRRGVWVFQVLIDDVSGPRPALQTTVFVGLAPREQLTGHTDADADAASSPDPARKLFAMLSSARAERGLRALARDPRLDDVAQRHAELMRRLRRLGHDVGDGDPGERLHASSLEARAVGENVAHASNADLAHSALWSSPSHRANLLDRRFDRVGIGVSADPDGSLWVAQLFAGSR